MNRPICLWMTSRSRSSLVSKIFANHGVWWGNTLRISKGYETYENLVIKQIQKDVIKPKSGNLPYCEKLNLDEKTLNTFHEKLDQHLYSSMPINHKKWSMKTGVEYFNAWKDLNPYNIFIKRNPYDISQSIHNKRIGDINSAFYAANWRFDYMDEIQKKYGGIVVDTDNIINGNYEEVEKAMEYCEIEYNQRALESAIDRQ